MKQTIILENKNIGDSKTNDNNGNECYHKQLQEKLIRKS